MDESEDEALVVGALQTSRDSSRVGPYWIRSASQKPDDMERLKSSFSSFWYANGALKSEEFKRDPDYWRMHAVTRCQQDGNVARGALSCREFSPKVSATAASTLAWICENYPLYASTDIARTMYFVANAPSPERANFGLPGSSGTDGRRRANQALSCLKDKHGQPRFKFETKP